MKRALRDSLGKHQAADGDADEDGRNTIRADHRIDERAGVRHDARVRRGAEGVRIRRVRRMSRHRCQRRQGERGNGDPGFAAHRTTEVVQGFLVQSILSFLFGFAPARDSW